MWDLELVFLNMSCLALMQIKHCRNNMELSACKVAASINISASYAHTRIAGLSTSADDSYLFLPTDDSLVSVSNLALQAADTLKPGMRRSVML